MKSQYIFDSIYSIEDTWGLWQTLLDDSKRFCNWLDDKEREVSNLCLDTPSIGPTKEEVTQFEVRVEWCKR